MFPSHFYPLVLSQPLDRTVKSLSHTSDTGRQAFSISLTLAPTSGPPNLPVPPAGQPHSLWVLLPSPSWLLSSGCLTEGGAHAGSQVQVQADGPRNKENQQRPCCICYQSCCLELPLGDPLYTITKTKETTTKMFNYLTCHFPDQPLPPVIATNITKWFCAKLTLGNCVLVYLY